MGPGLGGVLLHFAAAAGNLAAYNDRLFSVYGDHVRFRLGRRRILLLRRIEDARQVLGAARHAYRTGHGLCDAEPLLGRGLLTSDGVAWAHQRRILQLGYDNDALAEFGRTVTATMRGRLASWSADGTGTTIDAGREMAALAFETVYRGLLGGTDSNEAKALHSRLEVATRWIERRLASPLRLPLAVPTLGAFRAAVAIRRLKAWADGRLRDAPDTDSPAAPSLLRLLRVAASQPASELEMLRPRDQIITLLLAGHATTAASLTWALLLLAKHPKRARQLQAEIDRVLNGRPCTPADIGDLAYLQATVAEVLRLAPPVWILSRQASQDDVVGGVAVAAGTHVLIDVRAMHRHPDYWIDPMDFRPERFIDGALTRCAAAAYMPFGYGARTCIGRNFGQLETSLALALIVQRFRLETSFSEPPRITPGLTLRPRNGPLLRLVPREPRSASEIE